MPLSASPTLFDILTRILRRLGQGGNAEPIWEISELLAYHDEGTQELTRLTNILWDRDALDDLPPAANHSFHFEPDFIRSRYPVPFTNISNLDIEIHTIGARAEYDFPWEYEYANSTAGPGEIDFPWERLYAPATSLHCASVVPLPDDTIAVERVTWDDRRIDPLHSSELEKIDRVYEKPIYGDVIAYTQDKDGFDNLRKWHIPIVSAIPHVIGIRGIPRGVVNTDDPSEQLMHIDEWGIVISGVLDTAPMGLSLFWDANPSIQEEVGNSWDDPILGFGSLTVEGDVGALRQFPDYHPARSVFGLARRISPSARNTMVEHRRTAIPASDLSDRPELAPYLLLYVRSYVMWRALKRRGPGQNLKLSEHYRQRWEAGKARIARRMERAHMRRDIVLGGGSDTATSQPALARPPWDLDYGQVDEL